MTNDEHWRRFRAACRAAREEGQRTISPQHLIEAGLDRRGDRPHPNRPVDQTWLTPHESRRRENRRLRRWYRRNQPAR